MKSADKNRALVEREPEALQRRPLAGTKHLFLVEGQTEEGVVRALLRRDGHGKSATQIRCVKGVTNLGRELRTLVSEPEWNELCSVTVLVDADDDPEGRNTSVWNALAKECGLGPPEVDLGKKEGYVVSGGIRYAVWLSPGGGRAGRIEDLVLDAVPQETRKFVHELWRRFAEDGNAQVTISSKAEAAVLSALWTNDAIGLKTAIERGVFNLDHAVFEPLRELIRRQLQHRRS